MKIDTTKNSIRSEVLKKYGLRCYYCFREKEVYEITLDHVIPKSKGGLFTLENLVPACRYCNTKKANHILTREEVFRMKVKYKEKIVQTKEKIIKTKKVVIHSVYKTERARQKVKRLELNNQVAQFILKSLKGI